MDNGFIEKLQESATKNEANENDQKENYEKNMEKQREEDIIKLENLFIFLLEDIKKTAMKLVETGCYKREGSIRKLCGTITFTDRSRCWYDIDNSSCLDIYTKKDILGRSVVVARSSDHGKRNEEHTVYNLEIPDTNVFLQRKFNAYENSSFFDKLRGKTRISRYVSDDEEIIERLYGLFKNRFGNKSIILAQNIKEKYDSWDGMQYYRIYKFEIVF